MTNYRRGVRKERATIEKLESLGYHAYRTAGSHGPFDIIAWNEKCLLLIQVKYGKRPTLSQSDRDIIEDMSYPPNTKCEVWLYTKGVGEPKIERL